MNKSKPRLAPPHEKKLRALCTLSNVAAPLDFGYLNSLVHDAPDPETAVRGVLRHVPHSSDVLTRKWRTVIIDLWAFHHPHVPLLPQLTLSTEDVAAAPLLADAKALLESLETTSAKLVQENHEWFVRPEDVITLANQLPSLAETPLPAIESEWSCMPFRRLRAVLQATRLIRPMKGELLPVRSRVDRFLSLPAAQQLYILWHADVYHVDWHEFSGLWGAYMRVVQEYLPLLWEASSDAQPGEVADRSHWAIGVMELFMQLWDDEGLLDVRHGHRAALQIVQQHALPTIIDRFLLRDLLERHGLVTIKEEFGSISKFTWTNIGASLMPAEAGQQLPCGNDLLDNK